MGVAVSRFDNQKLFKNIKNCMLKKMRQKDNGNFVTSIVECRKPYLNALTKETKKVIKQLLPYRKYYETLTPVPNAEEMEKVDDGNNFMWIKKHKTNRS